MTIPPVAQVIAMVVLVAFMLFMRDLVKDAEAQEAANAEEDRDGKV